MSNSDSIGALPPGYSPPFSTVTDENHAAWLIIATALGLACVFVFISARVVVRFSVSSTVGMDDWLLGSSLVMTIVQSAVLLGGCSVGLGESMTHFSPHQQVQVQKINYTSNLLWIIAIGLSKISVAVLIRRIDAFGKRSNVFNVALACIVAWTVASFFAIALKCNLSHPWLILDQHCTNVYLRWKVICAFDIITELVLFASAVYLVWELQTEFGRKATIVAGFACRLPIIVPIAFRLATFDQAGYSDDPSLRMTLFNVWTQTELNYSIICATIPSLLHFMKNLNTTFGAVKDPNASGGSRRRSPYSFSKTFTRTKTKTEVSQRSRRADDEEELTVFETDESAGPRSAAGKDSITSSNSQNSQSLVIQKAVAYSVQYE